MSRFRSILVANRGEIALRIMRTARQLGYRTIAVCSEADTQAPHVRFADETAVIGLAPVAESYLSIERILAAAADKGAQAVHPGYGFLSENPDFAEACNAAGLVFIGPPAQAIDLMGNKARARRHMAEAGVPCVPGYDGEDQSDEALTKAAQEIGYPVMIKAAAGGGGRGMRLVDNARTLAGDLERARQEAQNAFGSSELILEKAVLRPRHVEIQVMADRHGNVVHLGERDCSVQRRHQKVIEEAPCPVMTPELREAMGSAAVQAAQSIGYEGAGTVEFLLGEDGAFYFLEMNTRLQVEHPVTEMVTGHDLVALQIAIAQGEPLRFAQSDVALRGHAIEARLYAEDPGSGFLPSTGRIDLWRVPEMEGVRVDAGIATGQEVSPFYDPMLAKIIAYGGSREEARLKLVRTLEQTVLFGVADNCGFLTRALEKDCFVAGEATTAFIEEEFEESELGDPPPTAAEAALAAALLYCTGREAALAASVGVSPGLLNWSSSGALRSRYRLRVGEQDFDLTVEPGGAETYKVATGEAAFVIDGLSGSRAVSVTVDSARVRIDAFLDTGTEIYLAAAGRQHCFERADRSGSSDADMRDGTRVVAPMHGSIVEVLVQSGDNVEKGRKLAVLEAMKMQHEIVALIDGTVREAHGIPGKQVAAGDLLFAIDSADAS